MSALPPKADKQQRSESVAAEWRFGTEPTDQVRRDLGNAAHAEQCHIAIHLILQQGKRTLYARLASSHRREEERPADKHELRAKRERLEHVGAAPHAPVQYHGHTLRLGCDLGQRAQRRHRMVKLPAAMI